MAAINGTGRYARVAGTAICLVSYHTHKSQTVYVYAENFYLLLHRYHQWTACYHMQPTRLTPQSMRDTEHTWFMLLSPQTTAYF